jgi:aryl-alcohol dehydrogenase-like predicted oxidoreductase
LDRKAEGELFALCEEHGLGFTAYSPIAAGILAGKYQRGRAPEAGSRLSIWPGAQIPSDKQYDAIDRLAVKAAMRGVSPGALALAWVIAQPFVTASLSGPSRNPEYLRVAREALTIELDEAEWIEIGSWFDED